MNRPLDGFRVLDLTRFLSGPYATMILADMGADVLKVERAPDGDDARAMSPVVNGESYAFALPNRNKRSIAMDLKDSRALAVFMTLVAEADVVVENFRPGVADKLGVGYEALRAVRPDLVYCSISGFGQTGPDHARPGYDIIAQGQAGFMRMTGHPGDRPVKVGFAVTDIAAGMTAAQAVLAALIHRLRTGEGQSIDIALVDSGLAWTVWEAAAYFATGEQAQPTGTRHRRSAPYQAYETADGYVTIGANTDRQWIRLCIDVLGRPAWPDDLRFATVAARMDNIDELEREIELVLREQPTRHWIELLDRAGIPAGPVLTYAEALHDEHTVARNMVVDQQHPVLGAIKALGIAHKLAGTPLSVEVPAPWLGQHTLEVLQSAGLPADEIADMFTEGIVYDRYREDRPA